MNFRDNFHSKALIGLLLTNLFAVSATASEQDCLIKTDGVYLFDWRGDNRTIIGHHCAVENIQMRHGWSRTSVWKCDGLPEIAVNNYQGVLYSYVMTTGEEAELVDACDIS